jgi:hypothetical protein
VSSGMLRRVALVRTVVSEEPSASFIRVTRIGQLGTTLAATSNRRALRKEYKIYISLHFKNIVTSVKRKLYGESLETKQNYVTINYIYIYHIPRMRVSVMFCILLPVP